jgi:hypothetical protein
MSACILWSSFAVATPGAVCWSSLWCPVNSPVGRGDPDARTDSLRTVVGSPAVHCRGTKDALGRACGLPAYEQRPALRRLFARGHHLAGEHGHAGNVEPRAVRKPGADRVAGPVGGPQPEPERAPDLGFGRVRVLRPRLSA